ncbi:phosphatidylinositol N-acetylglucosaminyltransferase subunit C-like [Babylonia areolata]|uniref:phosphatidylinositol N-acetylglucosaminyltransferase subunit C-like n=1 Tax=Babylonia areolata TaxID=304850 RepID=UPI003FD48F1F
MIVKMAGVPKWRKILYENQGVPDNYVDESFLDELKKNLYTRTYSYQTLLVESGAITQQLSSVSIFVVSFMYMEEKWLSPQLLVLVTSLATLALYFVNILVTDNTLEDRSNRTYVDDVKTAVLFLGISFILSPVLVSLTETISTDTIYAMTTIMLLANLLFHDYTAAPNRVPGALSLSAAMFASVCLASRLHTPWHAFATVTFSFQLFALWPVLRCRLQRYFSIRGQLSMTTTITAATFSALASMTTVGAVLYAVAFLFVTFVCPAWLISLQRFKNNIYGPWDEAEIKVEKEEEKEPR